MIVQDFDAAATSGITVEYAGEIAVIRLTGEHDLSTAPQLRVTVERTVVIEGRSGVVIDLSAVEFMDSAIVNALLIVNRRLIEQGRRLILLCDPGTIADRVLSLSVGDALGRADTLEAGVAAATG